MMKNIIILQITEYTGNILLYIKLKTVFPAYLCYQKLLKQFKLFSVGWHLG